MPRKRYAVEQILSKLRESGVELSRGATTAEVCRKIGVSDQTYYRWRKEYGDFGSIRPRDSRSSSGRTRGLRSWWPTRR